jgi:putative transposase
MATFRRALTSGATYFFTVNTYQRQAILTEPTFYQALKQSIRTVRQTHPFEIDAFVLLPDHLHCMWTLPQGDADYALRWNIIKRLVSQQTRHLLATNISPSRSKRSELSLWQRRFWEHQIRDDDDAERYVAYIHWNPVKHGYVKQVVDWPYSSFHRFVRRGIYPVNWGGTLADQREGDGFGEAR